MDQFSYKWFLLGYFILSGVFTIQGLLFMFSPAHYVNRLQKYKAIEKAPSSLIKIIRYMFLFGLLSFIFAFFPFKIQHLLYSFWVFTMVFITGKTLINWQGFCKYWEENSNKLDVFFQKLGGFFLIIGIATFVILLYSI